MALFPAVFELMGGYWSFEVLARIQYNKFFVRNKKIILSSCNIDKANGTAFLIGWHLMLLKCEEPLDELTVQVWLLYVYPNLKYGTLYVNRTKLPTEKKR